VVTKPVAEVVVVKLGGRALEAGGGVMARGAGASAGGTKAAKASPGAMAAAVGAAHGPAAGDAGAGAPGGRAVADSAAPGTAVQALASEIASLGAPAVVVHGGGAEVSAWCDRLAVAPRFLDGLRVTDPATLEVAVAVLAGLANKRLVAGLRAAGLDAVGLSALDGGTIEAGRHPRAEALGAVGSVRAVRTGLLTSLLDHGRTPVVASICDFEGALLNLNADDLAAALAGALQVRDLVLLSDAPGLVLGGAVVPRLHAAALERVLDHPDVQGGMRPKLAAARAAIAAGVGRVHIASWSGRGTLRALLDGRASGTTILAAHARDAAPAAASAPTGAELASSPRGEATSD
jgi:acetylglutamate kinase